MRTDPAALNSRAAVTSADELLALLDALPASVALWDADVRLRYGNHRSLVRFGRPVAELAGAHLSQLVQPHAVELSAQYIEGALAGQVQQVERAMVDPQGRLYNAHQVTHVPNVVDGVVEGYCALAVDITVPLEGYRHARRAREAAALQAERDRVAGDHQRVLGELGDALARLDAAVERAGDALPVLDDAVDAIERTIGDLRATFPASLLAAASTARPAVAFPQISRPFDATDLGDAIDPDGPGVPSPTEITGRGWTADEVVALLDLVPAAIAVWDVDLRNVFANRAAVRWFGRTDRGEVIGRTAGELLGADAQADHFPPAAAALAGESRQVERTVVRPTGLRHVQASYLPRRRGGVVDGVYTMLVDVTARVEAELVLQEARAELAGARERERIADELHNLVIQRLFAAGLAAAPPLDAPEPAADAAAARIRSVQDGILAALGDLESAVTNLRETAGHPELLAALAGQVGETAAAHGFAALIENVGSVDYVAPEVGDELLGAAAGALADVAERGGADHVLVTVAADAASTWLRVVDDGAGAGSPGSRATELLARAERLGGRCTWRADVAPGTVVDWRVPNS